MGKIKFEIPIKGLCPLQCFTSNLIEWGEDGKPMLNKKAEQDLLERGICHIPALFMAEGLTPTENRIIECAAIDTRKSYIYCEHFLRWFWHTVARENKFLSKR
jgi:hypothetical protein